MVGALQDPFRSLIDDADVVDRLHHALHGRDVREYAIDDAAQLWDLLDGVARSVILDQRMRIKQALSHAPETQQRIAGEWSAHTPDDQAEAS